MGKCNKNCFAWYGTVQQSGSNDGRAEKKEVEQMVRLTLQYDKLPKLDDTVDAIAIAICHSRGII